MEDVSDVRTAQTAAVVVINEFLAGSSGKIELYNAGDTAADLSSWQIDDIAGGGYAPKNLGASVTLPAHGYLVVGYAGVNTASADEVRLLDASGAVVDSRSNFYSGSSTANLCFGRRADGGAWVATSIPCTLGGTNGCAATGACDDGNACTTGETYQADCHCGGGAPLDGSPCGDQQVCRAGACALAELPDFTTAPAPDMLVALDLTTPPPSPDLATAPDLTVAPSPDLATAAPAEAVLTTLARRDRVLLRGTIVTPDQFFPGELLVEGDTITCVAASCATQPGAVDASVVTTNGVILPGLIDAHNHILFNIFDENDWSPTKVYTNHNQWPNDARYSAMVDAKQHLNGEGSSVSLGCEMDKYGELKGLIAGTTSIQGSANPANKLCYGSLARTIDQGSNDLADDKIATATIFPSTSTADSTCNNINSGATHAYVIHIAEGVDATARAEFGKLGTITTVDNCFYSPHTTVIHGTALGDPELSLMGQNGMSLVWSPRSNVFLYGQGVDLTRTANIPLARSKGINVALAPDWSIGGSQNLLDELRFAHQVDDTVWGNVLTPKALTEMVTVNAAKALGISAQVGSLTVGKKADVLVIGGDATAPYDALLASTPKQVRLVMVGGVALYGDRQLKALGAPTPGCEDLDICTAPKFACVAEAGGTSSNKLGQTLGEITTALTSALQSYDDLNLTQWNFSPIAPLVKCQ